MNNQDIKQLADDVLEILISRFYPQKIVKTSLVNELRQTDIANVDLTRSWSLSTIFINSELINILHREGFEITYTGRATFISI